MTITGQDEPLIRVLYDESRSDLREPDRPRPIRVYLWEPGHPPAAPAPLVVVSHGTGGSGSNMDWLVRPLREAGFRVVALDHHGNNFVDGYEPEGFLHVWERPLDVSFVLDVLAREQPLGPVGAAGFSLGAYTSVALAGARLDPQILGAVVTGAVPLPEIPEFPGVLEALLNKYPDDEASLDALDRAGADVSDARVRAVFQVAPGVGALVTPESLATVRVPVEIRWGGADTIAPYDLDTRPYLDHIPTANGRSAGPDVRHDDFFAPRPADPAVRDRVGEEAAAFFLHHLGRPGTRRVPPPADGSRRTEGPVVASPAHAHPSHPASAGVDAEGTVAGSTIEGLTRQALRIRDLYDVVNRHERGRVWTREEFMLGFLGDVGDLAKLVMGEEGAREAPGGRTALEHELADCLWSVLVLAHLYDVDLESAFGRTVAELDAALRSRHAKATAERGETGSG
ncbi:MULTISPECIES: serine aminopeptidase domain-containing protein [Streptomyces]|uniref:serine aminopeptidase domain-containing protein n=1 Tax=Streptomyces TaxID=1883 RepID=UPI001F19B4B2|nr:MULTISPECIES: alpha/beta hydrolase [Streptomyces]